jgi:hypothetical protein
MVGMRSSIKDEALALHVENHDRQIEGALQIGSDVSKAI